MNAFIRLRCVPVLRASNVAAGTSSTYVVDLVSHWLAWGEAAFNAENSAYVWVPCTPIKPFFRASEPLKVVLRKISSATDSAPGLGFLTFSFDPIGLWDQAV